MTHTNPTPEPPTITVSYTCEVFSGEEPTSCPLCNTDLPPYTAHMCERAEEPA